MGEKRLANPLSDKRLISKIYKKLILLNIKKKKKEQNIARNPNQAIKQTNKKTPNNPIKNR